jgi:hypothetical protein
MRRLVYTWRYASPRRSPPTPRYTRRRVRRRFPTAASTAAPTAAPTLAPTAALTPVLIDTGLVTSAQVPKRHCAEGTEATEPDVEPMASLEGGSVNPSPDSEQVRSGGRACTLRTVPTSRHWRRLTRKRRLIRGPQTSAEGGGYGGGAPPGGGGGDWSGRGGRGGWTSSNRLCSGRFRGLDLCFKFRERPCSLSASLRTRIGVDDSRRQTDRFQISGLVPDHIWNRTFLSATLKF